MNININGLKTSKKQLENPCINIKIIILKKVINKKQAFLFIKKRHQKIKKLIKVHVNKDKSKNKLLELNKNTRKKIMSLMERKHFLILENQNLGFEKR